MKDLLFKIAINKIPKVGAITAKNLISYCGGVEAVFKASKRSLAKIPGVGTEVLNNIVNQKVLEEAEKEMTFIKDHDIRPLFFLDEDYPQRIKHLNKCPVMLYYKGSADLNSKRIVGIVGTRKPTVHGVHYCEELVEGLKDYDVVTISGLAYGIDITAHKKSLECGIETIGVLGHGLKMIYPRTHKSVAYQMVEQGGLLSEYTSDVEPEREHFPARNRIIAGMCDALVVVESAKKGGSIITAEFANNFYKDVFAFPGKVSDKYAEGCNRLIKQNKAHLIESAQDIGYIMRWEKDQKSISVQKQLFVNLTEKEQTIVDILSNSESHIDQLTHHCNISNSEMAGLLLGLEFKGLIKTLPGKRYILV